MKQIRFSLTILCVIFLLSCAPSKFIQTGKLYPAYNGPVKVLTELPKDQEYEEIGWVSSNGGSAHQWTDLIESMQREAASKGANAIVLNRFDKSNTGMIAYNPQFGLMGASGAQKSLMAIAIRVKE